MTVNTDWHLCYDVHGFSLPSTFLNSHNFKMGKTIACNAVFSLFAWKDRNIFSYLLLVCVCVCHSMFTLLVFSFPYILFYNIQEHMGLRSSLTLEYYKNAYTHIVEQYPYWSHSSGRDHIWVMRIVYLTLKTF